MPSIELKHSNPAPSLEAEAVMTKYGIVRVPVDYFHFGKFRYTNLSDAVTAAKLAHRAD